ncbi:MAG: hypothetical protein A2504_06275 [Bdellovibrionales bacterium RIFOXYD12_FULL_39_22]|nr:MAG: hypothetical protein A2385_08595 [Bdellovibrionales bacterium RIFOXYB1_FULL_39_21]OFZ45237.1 MAG: hypothetical protein A2485_05935 [Bdellovibrionales bacterium RIFOXYC12_FULL_39_17]OFZ45572.1 MAG: hypothetical protein A2404_03175 [Bdellovibrionales bacterium RIFOXYC1_FULL_39_130]OFZ73109.1 MAG: hypothetical protein A2451_02990 [Bdellovibrionales bacterium RIFOXYC2_FULL_39_8]OFZ77433.1 MAG: hypothetical protein A2560_08765 [Bdellovibrionales bacterium RIFOXYD1_FULL_39_84]OFZ91562.1 MAG:
MKKFLLVSLQLMAFLILSFSAFATAPWAGNFGVMIERGAYAPCSAPNGINNGSITVDSWTRQRASVAHFCFEVYVEGLVDSTGNQFVAMPRINIKYRVQDNSDRPFGQFMPQLFGRKGNNLIFGFDLRTLDPYNMTGIPGGAPNYELYIELDGQGFGYQGDTYKIRYLEH